MTENITQLDKDIKKTKANIEKLDIDANSLANKVSKTATDVTTIVAQNYVNKLYNEHNAQLDDMNDVFKEITSMCLTFIHGPMV